MEDPEFYLAVPVFEEAGFHHCCVLNQEYINKFV